MIGTCPLEINVVRTENTFGEYTSQGQGKPQDVSLRDGGENKVM